MLLQHSYVPHHQIIAFYSEYGMEQLTETTGFKSLILQVKKLGPVLEK